MAMTEEQKGMPNCTTTFPVRKSKGRNGRNTALEAGATWQKLQSVYQRELKLWRRPSCHRVMGGKYSGILLLLAVGLPSVSPVGQTYQEVRKQGSRKMQFPMRQSRVEKAGMDLETNWCI